MSLSEWPTLLWPLAFDAIVTGEARNPTEVVLPASNASAPGAVSPSVVSIALTEARAQATMEMQLAWVKLGLQAEVSLTYRDNIGALKLIVAFLEKNHFVVEKCSKIEMIR